MALFAIKERKKKKQQRKSIFTFSLDLKKIKIYKPSVFFLIKATIVQDRLKSAKE